MSRDLLDELPAHDGRGERGERATGVALPARQAYCSSYMSHRRDDSGDDTSRIAGLFGARIATARNDLRARMEMLGLGAQSGWRLHEEVVTIPGAGMAYKLRPVHRVEQAPEDLTVLVRLD